MAGINHIDFHKGQVNSVKIDAIICNNRCDFSMRFKSMQFFVKIDAIFCENQCDFFVIIDAIFNNN